MMTLVELSRASIGTTRFYVEARTPNPERPELNYAAVHHERIRGGIRPKVFYAATAEAALAKAKRYDDQQKEKYRQWRESASARRRNATSKT